VAAHSRLSKDLGDPAAKIDTAPNQLSSGIGFPFCRGLVMMFSLPNATVTVYWLEIEMKLINPLP